MASDNLVMWLGAMALEWFFLARKHGDKEDERNVGLENLGWFFIFLTAGIGIAVIESGESALAFILGGVMMVVALIKFIKNFSD